MIFDPLNKDVYVTNSMSDTVSIIQGTSLVTDLTVGGTPDYLALNTANHEIYVSDWSFRQVLAVSGTSNSLVSNIGVGSEVTVAAYNPTNHEIYALNGGSDNVSIITAKNTVSTTIAVGVYPNYALYDSYNHRMYVVNLHSASVSVLS